MRGKSMVVRVGRIIYRRDERERSCCHRRGVGAETGGRGEEGTFVRLIIAELPKAEAR